MTESWVNTTEEIQSAHKTKPSPNAAGFQPFRVNPANQFFQPTRSVSTSQLDEDKNNIRNPLQHRSEKKIQNNSQYIPNLPQTSNKSTVLPVGFIQTAQTRQSQTPALPSSKVKVRNVPYSSFDDTNSNFPITSGEPSSTSRSLSINFRIPEMATSIFVTLMATITLIETRRPTRQLMNKNL